jgi:hypothetical protein
VCVCVFMYPLMILHHLISCLFLFPFLSNDKELVPGCIVDARVCMYGLCETNSLYVFFVHPIPVFLNFFSYVFPCPSSKMGNGMVR